jgi:hypothetical protein
MTLNARSKRYARHVRHDWRVGVLWPQGTVRTLCGSTVANRNADIPYQKNDLNWCAPCIKLVLAEARGDLEKIEAMNLESINSHFGISRTLQQKNHCLDIIIFCEPLVEKMREQDRRRRERWEAEDRRLAALGENR